MRAARRRAAPPSVLFYDAVFERNLKRVKRSDE
jgi:hypothetical protein